MSKNKFGKSVDVANAYATYRIDNPKIICTLSGKF